MKHRSRSSASGVAGILLTMLLIVGLVIFLFLTGMSEEQPPDFSDPFPEGADPYLATIPSAPERYYHQPVLICDDATVGVGADLWSGLCRYMEQVGKPITPDDAVYLCEQKVDNITAAIDRAEHEVVPSVILLAGDEAAQAVQARMETYVGTQFIVFGAQLAAPAANVCCFSIAEEQAGFLLGYGAAMEGLDSICCLESEDAAFSEAFLAGVVSGAETGAAIQGQAVAICTASSVPDEANAVISGSLEDYGVTLSTVSRADVPSVSLTTAELRPDNVVLAILQQWAAGGWSQFYGGKSLHYDLAWGDTVELRTDSWGFTHFSPDLYHQAVANLSMGSYTAAAAIPEKPQKVSFSRK